MIPTEKWLPLSGIMLPTLFFVDDADEVLNLCDHAADRRRVLQLGDPADLVELQPDQRRTLRVVAADRAVGLLDLDRLCGLGHRLQLRKAREARVLFIQPPLRRRRRHGATAASTP